MPNDRTKVIPLADLRTEPGSDELVRSESMKPYLEVLKAEMGGRDTGPPWLNSRHCRLSKDMSGE